MAPLRRQQLAWLSDEGWQAVLAQAWDAQAMACLGHWARHHLPLVVTRQAKSGEAGQWLALGLPAPARWGRRRLALYVPCGAVRVFGEFPALEELQAALPYGARHAAQDLQEGLAAGGTTARVYGSYGWEAITGLGYLRPGSDLDVWVAVTDMSYADDIAAHLRAFAVDQPRLDGELMFADGSAVAWREWVMWRAGRSQAVLVKRLTGAVLEPDATWLARFQHGETCA
jgi:phosphoribosyl-dephospho-CoA transferase